jgi:hypothetical protein
MLMTHADDMLMRQRGLCCRGAASALRHQHVLGARGTGLVVRQHLVRLVPGAAGGPPWCLVRLVVRQEARACIQSNKGTRVTRCPRASVSCR